MTTAESSSYKERLLPLAKEPISTLLLNLGTSLEGLKDTEVKERQKKFGPNAIAREIRPTFLRLFLNRFSNPLILLLLILAIISVFIGDPRSAVMMLLMILIGVGVGSVQESKSNRAAEELEAMVSTSASVLRARWLKPKEIRQTLLVPGDIVCLSAGDLIPADIRLLSAKDLSVSQSALTGESFPADKKVENTVLEKENIFDNAHLCFMGTSVVSGSAEAVVLFTGKDTYFGALSSQITGVRAKTNFEQGIDQFTWLMIRLILVMAPLVFLINGLLKGTWFEALLFALSVAVGLTPEMLPAIVTVNLAKGALAMSKKKVIVKRLNAIQNFGGMDILCTDKTGTITQNLVILQKHIDPNGNEAQDVLKFAYLNSFHQTGLKNLLDVAVLKQGDKEHIKSLKATYTKVDEIPFDFERKRMSVVLRHEKEQSHLLICKGAVEEVYNVCSSGIANGRNFPLDSTHKTLQAQLTKELNQDGFRVIAVAVKEIQRLQKEYSVKDETGLVLIGYLAFLDPPKETAREAIQNLNQAGVQVKILTGDNEIITRKICMDVGLNAEKVILGSQIDKISDEELGRISEEASIFAKLNPNQKARIIKCLQKLNHVVGYLGDGINDGPALRNADVGISVDSAVDVAKESADIILLKKSLLVLRDGVIEGRRVFSNIIKYIKMGASSNFGNMFSVLGASAFLPFLPMQPIQVLANNLLYDISQTAIPTDNVDAEFLLKPQAWEIKDLRKFIFSIGPISSIFDYTTFFIMLGVFHAKSNPALFQTGWFVESLATQTLIIHVIRTNKIPFLQSRASLPLMLTSGAIIALSVWLPNSPLASSLKLVHLPFLYWPLLAGTLLAYIVLTQLVKMFLLSHGPGLRYFAKRVN